MRFVLRESSARDAPAPPAQRRPAACTRNRPRPRLAAEEDQPLQLCRPEVHPAERRAPLPGRPAAEREVGAERARLRRETRPPPRRARTPLAARSPRAGRSMPSHSTRGLAALAGTGRARARGVGGRAARGRLRQRPLELHERRRRGLAQEAHGDVQRVPAAPSARPAPAAAGRPSGRRCARAWRGRAPGPRTRACARAAPFPGSSTARQRPSRPRRDHLQRGLAGLVAHALAVAREEEAPHARARRARRAR